MDHDIQGTKPTHSFCSKDLKDRRARGLQWVAAEVTMPRTVRKDPVMRIRNQVATAAFLALVLGTAPIGVAVAAAGSAPAYQPDGRIRQPCPERGDCTIEWFGNNIYNTTAAGQKSDYGDYLCDCDGPVVFRISIQNDGTASDRIRVLATGRTAGYKVRFFRGTTDITSAIKAGTYRTPWLAPGDRILIKAKTSVADDPVRVARLVTLTSVSDPAKQDAVKFVREWIVCGC